MISWSALQRTTSGKGNEMLEIPSRPPIPVPGNKDASIDNAGANAMEDGILEAEESFSEDDWADWDPADPVEPPTGAGVEAYEFADNQTEGILKEKLAAGEPERNPAEFLRFVAKNTNPGWASFAWENFVNALKECYEKKSLSPLFNLGLSLNCVHCTRAVDLTLHQALSCSAGGARFVQAAQGRAGSFTTIFQDIKAFSSRDDDARYLERLKAVLLPGQRACITVPVTGVKGRFSHAMNLVNLGPGEQGSQDRIFILCGQSGRVFDLHNESDVAAFYARHTNDSPGDFENDVKYVISSDEPEEADSALHQMENRPSAASGQPDPLLTGYA